MLSELSERLKDRFIAMLEVGKLDSGSERFPALLEQGRLALDELIGVIALETALKDAEARIAELVEINALRDTEISNYRLALAASEKREAQLPRAQ